MKFLSVSFQTKEAVGEPCRDDLKNANQRDSERNESEETQFDVAESETSW